MPAIFCKELQLREKCQYIPGPSANSKDNRNLPCEPTCPGNQSSPGPKCSRCNLNHHVSICESQKHSSLLKDQQTTSGNPRDSLNNTSDQDSSHGTNSSEASPTLGHATENFSVFTDRKEMNNDNEKNVDKMPRATSGIISNELVCQIKHKPHAIVRLG